MAKPILVVRLPSDTIPELEHDRKSLIDSIKSHVLTQLNDEYHHLIVVEERVGYGFEVLNAENLPSATEEILRQLLELQIEQNG